MNQVQISPEAKSLISQFNSGLKEKLDNLKLKPVWTSITDLLLKKYNIIDTDRAYLAIDFRNKTVFLDQRGNEIIGSILSYQQSEMIIDMALNEELP